MSKGNPLLGLNRARTSKLRVLRPSPSALFDVLVNTNTPLQMPLVRKHPGPNAGEPLAPSEPEESVSPWAVIPGDVEFDAEPSVLYRRLRRIRDNARLTVEERGVTTLHLALGTVAWTDQRLGESVAPLWLVPCALISTGADSPLRLELSEDEPQLNPALALYLREVHKKSVPELANEPASVEIDDLLKETRQRLGGDWQVRNEAWLSTFSFEALVLYKDLENLEQVAVEHPVVRAFAGASVRTSDDRSERLGDDLDTAETPSIVPIPTLPADSSQLAALTYAHGGQHVLVYGPPGTGKSQTISNLIADALGQGKTVLFVSAKMAALEVVHDRLRKQGFDRFCLEAHSTRSGKARVIDELRNSLKLAQSVNGADHTAEVRRYSALRQQLNEVVHELHRVRAPLDRTIYEALGIYAHLRELSNVEGKLPWPDHTAVGRADLDEATDCLAGLQGHADVFAKRDSHAWRGCRVENASYATRERLLRALEQVRATARAMLGRAAAFEPFLGPLQRHSFNSLESSAAALSAIAESEWLPAGWTSTPSAQLAAWSQGLRVAATKRRELEQARASFAQRVAEPQVDPEDALELLEEGMGSFGSWFSRLSLGYRGWKKRVKASVRPTNLDYAALVTLAELAKRSHERLAWFAEHTEVLKLLPGSNVSGLGVDDLPDVGRLEDASAALARAATIKAERQRLGLGPADHEPGVVDTVARQDARAILSALPSTHAELSEALGILREAFGDDFLQDPFLAGQPVDSTSLGSLAARASEPLNAPDELAPWIGYHQARQRCLDAGLGSFLKALERHGAERAVKLFLRRFWLLWSDTHIAKTPCLNQFHGAKRADLIDEFTRVDTALRRSATLEAIDAAAQGAIKINTSGFAAKTSQLGVLRHELQKKRPRPLRRLFAEIPQVLQTIKPCMLMSPISVSTYLARGQFHFDLVVFDEASQIPPAEAIPSILRATQVVVAGDDKQLPPTSFFSSSLFADEADEEEERVEGDLSGLLEPQPYAPLESLLNDCEATVPLFQPAHLKWHYRSRDERLIAFSNHTFYGGELITFPTPGAPADRGVQLYYLPDGVWDRGRSRTNRVEAREMAGLVLRHIEEHPGRSMGVVALNVAQKEAIDDALDEALAPRADLRALLYRDDVAEPFFVKALENVQGDERDTIFISTGYGRDASGAMSLNFGPINQEGGWRRLNVLVTRAKYLLVLVTSLRSDQLRAVAPGNRGAVALREFIRYAEGGGQIAGETPQITHAETNEFEDAIAAALRNNGLQVDEQIGASSFRIDLAVRDPRDPAWYLLGVECDGATYHSSRTARDRDVLRAQMLRELGWRLHRIWSVDWFRDPDRCVKSTLAAVERAMRLGAPGEGVPAPSSTQPPAPVTVTSGAAAASAPETAPEYPAGILYHHTPPCHNDRNLLLDPACTSRLSDEVRRIVHHEEPIHEELALRRARELNGVGSAKSNVRANFERALSQAVRRGHIQRDVHGFLRVSAKPITCFRIPGQGEAVRAIEHISPEEIRRAILHVIEAQFGLERKTLIPETAYSLGYGRTSMDISERIGSVVDDMIEMGQLQLSGFQITLP